MRDTDRDDTEEEPILVGAPLHWYDVALPPFLLAAAAVGIPLIVMTHAATLATAVLVVAGGAVTLAAAVALAYFGVAAYRELSPAAIRRYQTGVCAALLALGLLLVLSPSSAVALAAAGYRAAMLRYDWSERVARRAASETWRTGAVWAGVAALVVTIGKPLATHLGSPILLVAVLVLAVALPTIAGFAYRLGRGDRQS
ncbi:hypothetical protein AB4Z18_05590 [Leifsonia sp. 2TAF2]|uniref:hypothetical protein n=1 Tax=Leifsonia sp. 2TAF2 TaxID=3233009 RepID=UPI003F9737B4